MNIFWQSLWTSVDIGLFFIIIFMFEVSSICASTCLLAVYIYLFMTIMFLYVIILFSPYLLCLHFLCKAFNNHWFLFAFYWICDILDSICFLCNNYFHCGPFTEAHFYPLEDRSPLSLLLFSLWANSFWIMQLVATMIVAVYAACSVMFTVRSKY